MSDSPYKGGRSNFAPYKSTHIRIPEPLKTVFVVASDLYKKACNADDSLSALTFTNKLHVYVRNFRFDYGIFTDNNRFRDPEEIEALKEQIDYLKREAAFQEGLIEELKENEVKCKEILNESLKLGSNVGGKIKKEIRKAIAALD